MRIGANGVMMRMPTPVPTASLESDIDVHGANVLPASMKAAPCSHREKSGKRTSWFRMSNFVPPAGNPPIVTADSDSSA